MRLSIRARMVLAMNLLVAAVGVAVGYAAIEVATHQVEQRLIYESAENAARLIGRENWPLDSDALMRQVGQILGAETAASPAEGGGLVSSSLSGPRRAELARQLQAPRPPARIVLGGQRYRLGTAVVRRVSASPAEQPRRLRRFYLLVPERRVLAAQRQVAGRIAVFTVGAVLIATAVGFWLSTSIARPVRRLADRMDRLAREDKGTGPTQRPASAAGPTELARLTRSFDELLERLASARRQLARSARLAALGQLAGSVAHELRNPLSGIKMNARVLADELARAGEGDKSCELIIREIDRMDLYLQELLSVGSAPPDGAEGEVRMAEARPVRLEELADSVAALLAGRCEHAGVRVERRYEADAPAALAEPGRIRQVLLNLMLNALDAMPHGGRMALAVRRGASGAARFEVADSGPGVRLPEGADLFEPFVTTKPQGTGLGLYICRQALETFSGRVGYDSPPEGSVFWFELPPAS